MRRTLVIATLIFAATWARAQVAVYVTSSSAHLSNVEDGNVVTLNNGSYSYAEQHTGFWTSGIGGGLTFNFLPLGPVKLGFDLRGSTRPGTVGADTALAGIKLGFNPPLLPIKPYIQVSGGYVATRVVNVSNTSSNSTQTIGGTFGNQYAAWEVLGGLDYPLVKFIDFRVVEVGVGRGYDVFGSASSNLTLLTVDSGLVVHF